MARVYAYTYKTKAFFVACSEEKVESCEVSTRQNQRSLNALCYVFCGWCSIRTAKVLHFCHTCKGKAQNRSKRSACMRKCSGTKKAEAAVGQPLLF